MKLKNIYLALVDQLPLKRLWRNLWKGHLIGLVHKRSHFNHNGNPKVSYGSKASAVKAASKMQKKTGNYFSNYKCMRCDGWHIGKNTENKGDSSLDLVKDADRIEDRVVLLTGILQFGFDEEMLSCWPNEKEFIDSIRTKDTVELQKLQGEYRVMKVQSFKKTIENENRKQNTQ